MTNHQGARARRKLDERLAPVAATVGARPRSGWVRAIRDALGMSAAELGARMGVSQARVSQIERAEVDHAIKLETLDRAADALGCKVVYALVPNEDSLEAMTLRQARRVARRDLDRVSHTMRLEDQSSGVDAAEVEELARRLTDRRGLWK
jgi:predicted DNA-binding mobile mystery protein A